MDNKVKVHIWYIDGTEETFYADEDYNMNYDVFVWNIGDAIKSVPVRVVKKIEEE